MGLLYWLCYLILPKATSLTPELDKLFNVESPDSPKCPSKSIIHKAIHDGYETG